MGGLRTVGERGEVGSCHLADRSVAREEVGEAACPFHRVRHTGVQGGALRRQVKVGAATLYINHSRKTTAVHEVV